MVVDYHILNSITVKNRYTIPRIDELFDKLQGAKFFTKIDLTSGYHQIRIKNEDILKTAFRCRYGYYEFLIMPFRLTNVLATFQAVMQDILRPYLDGFVLVYIDDILIFSKTKKDHFKHIHLVLNKLRENQLYAKPSKCNFLTDSIEYLGHIVTSEGIKVDPHKIKTIKKWPIPKNVSEIRSFLGITGYYRRFVEGYSKIAKPITDLLHKDTKFEWTTNCQQAYQTLKDKLISAPILKTYDPEVAIRITTDASDFAIGAVLEQQFDDKWYPIAFELRKLSKAKENYAVHEKEILAIVHSIKLWRHYLEGHEFQVITDHQSLTYFQTQPTFSKRQARWNEIIQGHDYKIIYKPGAQNILADGLSRRVDHLNTIAIVTRSALAKKIREASKT